MIYYGVIVQPRAERDIEQAYQFRARHNRAAADRWLDGILEAIESLGEMPSRLKRPTSAAPCGTWSIAAIASSSWCRSGTCAC